MVEILSLIGLSAVMGAVVSIVFNYIATISISKRSNKLKLQEEKISLYSFLIYHLDRMRYQGRAAKEVHNDPDPEDFYAYFKGTEDQIIKSIDSKLESGYHLLNQDILKEWMFVSTNLPDIKTRDHVKKLRELLVTEYNDELIPEYEKYSGKRLRPIDNDYAQ